MITQGSSISVSLVHPLLFAAWRFRRGRSRCSQGKLLDGGSPVACGLAGSFRMRCSTASGTTSAGRCRRKPLRAPRPTCDDSRSPPFAVRRESGDPADARRTVRHDAPPASPRPLISLPDTVRKLVDENAASAGTLRFLLNELIRFVQTVATPTGSTAIQCSSACRCQFEARFRTVRRHHGVNRGPAMPRSPCSAVQTGQVDVLIRHYRSAAKSADFLPATKSPRPSPRVLRRIANSSCVSSVINAPCRSGSVGQASR